MNRSVLNLSLSWDSVTSTLPKCTSTILRKNSDPASRSDISSGTPSTGLNFSPRYALVLAFPFRLYALYVLNNNSTRSVMKVSLTPLDFAEPTISSNISRSLVSINALRTITTGTRYSFFRHEKRNVTLPSLR